jgi:hypothetical protein
MFVFMYGYVLLVMRVSFSGLFSFIVGWAGGGSPDSRFDSVCF